MQIAPRRQHILVAQQIATRRGMDIAAIERVQQRGQLVVGGQQYVQLRAAQRIGDGRRIQQLGAFVCRGRACR